MCSATLLLCTCCERVGLQSIFVKSQKVRIQRLNDLSFLQFPIPTRSTFPLAISAQGAKLRQAPLPLTSIAHGSTHTHFFATSTNASKVALTRPAIQKPLGACQDSLSLLLQFFSSFILNASSRQHRHRSLDFQLHGRRALLLHGSGGIACHRAHPGRGCKEPHHVPLDRRYGSPPKFPMMHRVKVANNNHDVVA